MTWTSEIQNSVDYLNSPEALKTVDADAYWPKWSAPWWHMLLLHEMGHTDKIPKTIIERYIASLNRLPVKIFPIHQHEMPEGLDPFRSSSCHCQLGNVYQVLSKWGVKVDIELPWIRPWFLRYQMQDGGLNCDNDAYLVKEECPSSMVGTIAAFEAILLYTPREFTTGEKLFLQKAADFLLSRKLMLGSNTEYNKDERDSALHWFKLCFPRFYLYDVLRGLHAITLWAERFNKKIPYNSISTVVDFMQSFKDSKVLIGRKSYEGAGTLSQDENGVWQRRQPATYFALLDSVSRVGEESPYLSAQWLKTFARIADTSV